MCILGFFFYNRWLRDYEKNLSFEIKGLKENIRIVINFIGSFD